MKNCTCTPAPQFASTAADLVAASRTALYQKIGSAELAARVANRRIREVENSPAATMGGRELIRDLATARVELAELDQVAAADYSDLVDARQKLTAAALALNLPSNSTPNDLAVHAAELATDRDRLGENLAPYIELGATPSELRRDLAELADLRDENSTNWLAGELADLRAENLELRDQIAELLKLGASYADRYDRVEIDRDRIGLELSAAREKLEKISDLSYAADPA